MKLSIADLQRRQESCPCALCTVLGMRDGTDREFVLRDTEPPKSRSEISPRSRDSDGLEEFREQLNAEMKKWGGV